VDDTPIITGVPIITGTAGVGLQTGTPAANSDAIDFARVAVLYLTDVQNLTVAGEAQHQLQTAFTDGVHSGHLSVGNNISVDFGNHRIKMPDGTIVGRTTPNSTETSSNGGGNGNNTPSTQTRKRSVLNGLATLFALK
jgi:hypothetical protein